MATRKYKAYLLRLWREHHEANWRALLENPNNGERAAFATLGELMLFLEVQTGEEIRPLPPPERPLPDQKETEGE